MREISGAEVRRAPEEHWGRYIQSGEGLKSLGTIRAERIHAVAFFIAQDSGKRDYRLRFRDATGEEFRLSVVALDFRGDLDDLVAGGLFASGAARIMTARLQRQDVFLRIGLARGWDRHPDRCYLQITGVYGFDVGNRVLGS